MDEQRARGGRPRSGRPVIERAFALLSAFDTGHPALSLGEIGRRAGIPKTSTLRLVRELEAWGALERLPGGRYVVGLKVWELGALSPRARGLHRVAMPSLGDLAQVTRHHVLLAVRDGDEAVLVERLSDQQATSALYDVGSRLPLHSTGVGLALLAFADAALQEDLLSRPLALEPDGPPLAAAALRRSLADVRRDGLAVVRRPAHSTVSVAAPVFGADDRVVAAMSVVVPEQGSDPRLLGPAVRTAARSVSRGLGARRAIGMTPPAPTNQG